MRLTDSKEGLAQEDYLKNIYFKLCCELFEYVFYSCEFTKAVWCQMFVLKLSGIKKTIKKNLYIKVQKKVLILLFKLVFWEISIAQNNLLCY